MTKPNTHILPGSQFGLLTVVRRDGTKQFPSGQSSPQWLCECACGTQKVVDAKNLKRQKSCGCWQPRQHIDLSGQRFGRLIAIDYVGQSLWLCRCDCGQTPTVRAALLRKGATRSCGCLSLERVQAPTRKEQVKYCTAHDRLRNARGRASAHLCVDCGEPAKEWAYDGNDANELHEWVNGSYLAFSLNLSAYSPRCHKCHRRFDVAKRMSA
jgi:hypothetical protein